MEEITKKVFTGRIRKYGPPFVVGIMFLLFLLGAIKWVDATVNGNTGHSLTGANSNIINSTNSGSYQVSYMLSGTLDIGDTLSIRATDGSGNTSIESFVSTSGGESSGSLLMNVSHTLIDGPITFSGIVYTGGLANQVMASGMVFYATLDTHAPIMSLIGSGGIILIQGGVYSDSGAIWSDIIDGTGLLAGASSGTVNSSVVGNYLLEYFRVDASGNTSPSIYRVVHIVAALDTIPPVVTVTSHLNNAIVTGTPTLSGLVSDSGGVLNVKVNGVLATLGSGSWSFVLGSLSQGNNTLTVIATDVAQNTGSTSIILNRVSIPSNIGISLSGTTMARIVFTSDLTATGLVHYGTNSSLLNMSVTGSSFGTSHSLLLTGLLGDTDYYFTAEGQGGQVSSVEHFRTPASLSNTVSGTNIVTGPLYISGSTGAGVHFTGSGLIHLSSTDPIGNFLEFPLSGLSIIAVGSLWDGVISPPTITSQHVNIPLSGYAFTGYAYQIGNTYSELVFSGQLATVSLRLGASLSGQIIKIYRSLDQGTTYTEFSTCTITAGGDCIFTTNHFSLFAFAIPADTIPNTFSFSSLSSTELSTLYLSNTITVSGITSQTSISVIGGDYSINGGPFTSTSGVVHLSDTVVLRVLSASNYNTTKSATLTIGGVSSSLSTTTKSSSSSGGGVVTGPGGPSSGGGGGTALVIDNCTGADLSPSYYDNLCTPSGNIITGIDTAQFQIPGIFLDVADVNFRDIGRDWAKTYIQKLVTRGIVDNVSFYRGDDSLTRSEFLKIVIRTAGWESSVWSLSIPFHDVVSESWYEPYVSIALSKGLIQKALYFRPHDSITRAEATKILIGALGVTVNEPENMTFADVNINSDLAKYIEAAVYLNILTGQMKNGQYIFRPSDPITRSEIAKVVANAFGL